MGLRAVVLFQRFQGPYKAYYKHDDGNPTHLGRKLIEVLQYCYDKGYTGAEYEEEIGRIDRLELYKDVVIDFWHPEEAFELQSDAEWIYTISSVDNSPYFTIYRTSNPYRLPSFIFKVWGSYIRYLKDLTEPYGKTVLEVLKDVQITASMMVKALESYHCAVIGEEHSVL